MQLFSSLHKRMTGRRHTRRIPARKLTSRFRPQLETLESREVPSFTSPVAYTLNGPQALVTADVNGDGKPDLISLVDGGGDIAVQLNNGKGGFEPANGYFTGASGGDIMNALAVSEFNGKPVVAVAGWIEDNIGHSPAPISWLFGNGKGGFTLNGPYYVRPDDAPISSLALADLYGNGHLELVGADRAGEVFVAGLGPGRAHDLYVPAVAANPGPCWVAVGDLNGDGKPDLVVANSGNAMSDDTVSVLMNNGNGTFAAAQTYTVGGSPTAVAVGDFNHDGKLDIVTANANGTVSVLFNNGNGTFGTAHNYAIGGPANSVAVGDFNHDGCLDVATTGAEMDLLWNNGNGAFGTYQKIGPAGSNLNVSDLNGDGFPDLAQIDAKASIDVGSIDVVFNNADWMTGPVSVSFGNITYNSNTSSYSETVTLTNKTSGTLTGPLSLELTALPSGLVLTDATGTTNGHPYIRFLNSGNALKRGASVSITLTFTAASLSDITFGTDVVVL
jgi:hypothetical protein